MNERKLKEKHAKLMSQLIEICNELGWIITLAEGKTKVEGLVLGNREYAYAAARKVYGENFEVVETSQAKPEPMSPFNEETEIIEMTESEYEEFLETDELPERLKKSTSRETMH